MSTRLTPPLALTAAIAVPAVALRATGSHPDPLLALLAYGAAVVAASFLLAWAAEAVQVDISGGLAIALLAFIAVLPEYAVDLYFALTPRSPPQHHPPARSHPPPPPSPTPPFHNPSTPRPPLPTSSAPTSWSTESAGRWSPSSPCARRQSAAGPRS